MDDYSQERIFWILRAVESAEMPVHLAEDAIKEIISDAEDAAFTRGQDSVQGAYNNLM